MRKIREVELRSDTMTKPTAEMRAAMFTAQVGGECRCYLYKATHLHQIFSLHNINNENKNKKMTDTAKIQR